jgi:hypothetical protein
LLFQPPVQSGSFTHVLNPGLAMRRSSLQCMVSTELQLLFGTIWSLELPATDNSSSPEFDAQQFPDVFAYNFGGVRRPPPNNIVLPRDQWNFHVIENLFQHVRILLRSNQKTFGLFGNSAGSQHVLRYLALNEAPSVDRAVASNSGVYMLPDLTLDYPLGMGGLDLDENQLRRYLGRRLIILLGDADTAASAPDLPRDDFAMAQGPHRLTRGQWYFEHCAKLAERLATPFGWRLQTVHGAGHVSQEVFERAANILRLSA